MKRDMDLIRELMLQLEDRPVPSNGIEWLGPSDLKVAGRRVEEIGYHLSLIEQAGFVDVGGADVRIRQMVSGIAFSGLSWTGHDFLDAVRSPDVWDRTKKVASAAGGFTVELLVFTAKTYLEGKIKGLISG